jgi:hypothetical protein
MRKRILFVALGLAMTVSACSTTYQPKRTDHVYLTVDNGQVALTKNGQTVPQNKTFSVLVQCDLAARDTAYAAQKHIRDGEDYAMFAAVLNYVLGPGSVIAIYISHLSAVEYANGHAGIVDSLNRHNDAATCRSPEASKT